MNKNNKNIFFNGILTIILTTLMIGFYHFVLLKGGDTESTSHQKAVHVAERKELFSEKWQHLFRSSSPTDFIEAAETAKKAVVFIKTIVRPEDVTTKKYFSTGSGVLVSRDGYIVTNHHVILGAEKVEVTLHDNRTFHAKLIGDDKNTDIALLKIETDGTDFLVFGNSDSLRIGEWVLAVGNPFRLQSSVTAGIVSAKGRNINLLENQGIESFIQTDAAFNQGSSGGALVNTAGQLVGISTAILSESGRYEGFSFAIPGNLAKKVVSDLIEFGVVQRGWLGIDILNVDNEIAENLGLTDISGVLIAHITKNSGADEAGLRSNDVIISVNNIKVNNTSEFMELLGQYRPGFQLKLVYVREQVKKTTTATLRNQLNSTDLIGVASSGNFKALGIEVRELDSYEKAVYTPNGIKVISIQSGSIVASTRMEPDYIITKINNIKITNINQLQKVIEELRGKSVIIEGFYPKYPGEYPYTFVIP